MTEILEKYQQILKEHLPAMAADEMKRFIEEAQNNARNIQTLQSNNKALTDQIQTNEELIKQLKANIALDNNLKSRQENVEAAERALSLERLKFEIEKKMDALVAAEANRRADGIYSLLSILVTNPRSIEIINHHRSFTTQADYLPGGGTTYRPVAEHTGGTTESKETKMPDGAY